MDVVPVQAVPSQTVQATLGGQVTQLKVYQTRYGLFVDTYVDSILILGGAIGEDRNRIIRDAYLGFLGDLVFIDTQGTDDPTYDGLGSRYLLCYLTTSDLATLGFSG